MKSFRSGKIFLGRALMLVEHCTRHVQSDEPVASAATQAYLHGASQRVAQPKTPLPDTIGNRSASRHGTHDQKRLGSCLDWVWQRRIRRLVRQILLAGEEPHERSALLRYVVADCPAQHRIASLDRVKHRALRHQTLEVQQYLAVDAR
jgi:hypothetical protein